MITGQFSVSFESVLKKKRLSVALLWVTLQELRSKANG